MKILLYILFLFLFSFTVLAETYKLDNHKGKATYGSNESKDKACISAKKNLYKTARQKIKGGETISGQSKKICKASNDYANCTMFTSSFHSLGKIVIISEEIGKCVETGSSDDGNIKEVTITGNLVLAKLKEVSDNFDFRARINQEQFVSYKSDQIKKRNKNDNLRITIEPMEDMYIFYFSMVAI